MFAQINDGNAIALPFAKGFGWGAELNLTYIFEKLFEGDGIQEYRGKDTVLHIGKRMHVFRTVHTVIVHFMPHRFYDFFQCIRKEPCRNREIRRFWMK